MLIPSDIEKSIFDKSRREKYYFTNGKLLVGSRGVLLEFEITNSSLTSKVESRKLAKTTTPQLSCGFGSDHTPMTLTAEEFQTEGNSCPKFRSVFGFQIYWSMMSF